MLQTHTHLVLLSDSHRRPRHTTDVHACHARLTTFASLLCPGDVGRGCSNALLGHSGSQRTATAPRAIFACTDEKRDIAQHPKPLLHAKPLRTHVPRRWQWMLYRAPVVPTLSLARAHECTLCAQMVGRKPTASASGSMHLHGTHAVKLSQHVRCERSYVACLPGVASTTVLVALAMQELYPYPVSY